MLFITGSESFIGKELIKRCIKNKIKYFGVDLTSKNTKNLKKIDIRDKNIKKYIPKNSSIIHLAAISKNNDRNQNLSLCLDVNLRGTLNLIDAAKKKSAKNFIFASSEWVYGDMRENLLNEKSNILLDSNYSLYALSKLIIEKFLINSKIFKNCNILRFGIIYGGLKKKNWSIVEKLFHNIKNKKIITIGSKKTARRYIHIDDLIGGILLSVKSKGNNIYNLTGNKLINIEEIIKKSEKCLNKKIKVVEKDPNLPSIRNIDNSKIKNNLKWIQQIQLFKYLKNCKNNVR